MLRITVQEGEEEPKVEITLPLRLAKWALKLLPKVRTKLEGQPNIDTGVLKELIEEGLEELEELGSIDLVKIREGDVLIRISIEEK
jgi:hypothetical protein